MKENKINYDKLILDLLAIATEEQKKKIWLMIRKAIWENLKVKND